MSSFAKSTATVTGLTAAGLCLGFVSNLLIAARFGVGTSMDTYVAATTLPNLISLILTTSLAATFVPVFTDFRHKDPVDAWRIVGAFTSLVGLASLAACLVLMLFSDPLVRSLAPGFDAAEIRKSADLLRLLLPTVVFTSINQILSGVHYTGGHFFSPLLIRVLAPLFTIVFLLAFGQSLETKSLVLAALAAHGIQTCVLLITLPREGRGNIRLAALSVEWNHPAVRKILRLAAPLTLAMCLYKLAPVFERWMASGLGTGAISMLGYATRLTQVIQPVLTSGIALSSFALMAGLVSRQDMAGLRAAMLRSCNALFFASVPLAVLLCGFATPVIGMVFERGAFSARDTADTSRLFALYVLALPAGAVGTVVGQTWYAFQRTRVPILVGLLDITLFVTLGTLLVPHWGLVALPASFVFSHFMTSLLVTHLLTPLTGFSVLPLFLRPFLQGLAASLLALAAGMALEHVLPGSYLNSMLCLGTAGIAYLLLQHFVFRSMESARLVRMLREWRARARMQGR